MIFVDGHMIDLLRELVVRDVRLRYRRSVLGVLWSQAAPLSMLLVFSLLFTRVVPLGIENYAVFTFTGLLAWQWFSGTLSGATSSVVEGRDLIRRPRFPLGLPPLVPIITQLVNYLLALPILFVAIALSTGRIPATAVSLPVLIALQFVLMLGPAYLLARMQVTLRDTSHLVGVLLILLFYATPVFYDEARIIDSSFAFVYRLNPFARLLTAYREALVFGRWPDPAVLLGILVVGAAGALFGVAVYRRGSAGFVEEL